VHASAKPGFDPRHLACPLDGGPLRLDGARLVCEAGHSFDIARQGYANLLPVQHKRSRNPGDSQAMVQARGAFLDGGAYQPVADRLSRLACGLLPQHGPAVVLDAGCGEGYYLTQLQRRLGERGATGVRLLGIDISKPAIIAATRRSRTITWLVASNVRPPLQSQGVDLLLCAFGFPSYPAFRELLKPGGRLLLLDPGPDHLLELRQVLYPDVRRRPPPGLSEAEQAGFRLVEVESLRYQTPVLEAERLRQLLTMTPHLYRAGPEGRAAALALHGLAVTVDVVFRTLVLEDSGPATDVDPG
jgi:23S rRNA (guanine745-N1)-methyltransferase